MTNHKQTATDLLKQWREDWDLGLPTNKAGLAANESLIRVIATALANVEAGCIANVCENCDVPIEGAAAEESTFNVCGRCYNKDMAAAEARGLERAAEAIPTSWLDSLLTGPDAVVGKPPFGCPDVEALLNAIKNRIAILQPDSSYSVQLVAGERVIQAAIVAVNESIHPSVVTEGEYRLPKYLSELKDAVIALTLLTTTKKVNDV